MEPITLFLCGDVMTGRGIDQILPHPSDPKLGEPWVGDAQWIAGVLDRESRGFGTRVRCDDDGRIAVTWAAHGIAGVLDRESRGFDTRVRCDHDDRIAVTWAAH